MFKRALVAASVVAAFAAPAMADATIYGSIRSSVQYSNAGDVSQTQIVDENSRIGFKGEEKLGGGLTSFFKSEHKIKTDGTASDFGGRDQVIGLKGDKLGTFTIGKTTTVYSDATILSVVLDDTAGLSDDGAYYQSNDPGRTSAVKYESPSYAGLAYAVSYNVVKTKTATLGDNYSTGATAGMLNYSQDKFNVGVAYLHIENNGALDAKSDNVLVGASVTPSAGLTFSAHYERGENKAANGSKQHQDNLGAGAEYGTGNWVYRTYYYTKLDQKGDAAQSDTGAQTLMVSARYALSKQTSVLAAASYMDADKNAVASSGNGVKTAMGGSGAVVSMGLKVNF